MAGSTARSTAGHERGGTLAGSAASRNGRAVSAFPRQERMYRFAACERVGTVAAARLSGLSAWLAGGRPPRPARAGRLVTRRAQPGRLARSVAGRGRLASPPASTVSARLRTSRDMPAETKKIASPDQSRLRYPGPAVHVVPVAAIDVEVGVARGLEGHVCRCRAGSGTVPMPGSGGIARYVAAGRCGAGAARCGLRRRKASPWSPGQAARREVLAPERRPDG
jgi:hypothetical protein